ncbi:metal ABC transporter substrate-binding protein [Pseudoflavonifractor sp. An85]|uniref:metal ABC transporter substrate-binding protein n=1 Tax=Pseudoflavonifractor sp. An85 TaxID=1965661 RepID=UPI001FA87D4A|nr:metal ABC transporter substrate-binding protein [Pseudoflavonifractor sp. An85]
MIVLCLSLLLLAGCAPVASQDKGEEKKLSVVTTVFPAYDWVREIVRENSENVDITWLMKSGVDVHSYQPTVDDLVTISNCDVLVYVGGESESWMEEALAQGGKEGRVVVNLMEELGDRVKEEEPLPGVEEDHDHDHEEEHEHEADEHIWLSLKNAVTLTQTLAQKLGQVDPNHAQSYLEAQKSYQTKLEQLDQDYQTMVQGAKYDTVLFCDRFPFRYLMDDYGIQYYAAFAGCSAETEASFETVAFLATTLEGLNLPCVLTIEGSDGSLARTVWENTSQNKQTMAQLNSLQAVTQQQVQEGLTYLSAMEDNLQALAQALQSEG